MQYNRQYNIRDIDNYNPFNLPIINTPDVQCLRGDNYRNLVHVACIAI